MRLKDKHVLILILLLAAFLVHIPHRGYDYPVHRDEWDRMSLSKAVIKAEGARFVGPFLGEEVLEDHLEIGFIVWLAVLKLLTQLSWFSIFRYFPIFIAVFLVLSTYIFAKKWGYGLEAAFFVSLIPTTVSILGPGFLVPVSLGMGFIMLSLFLATNAMDSSYDICLFLTVLFLLYVHPPSALALFIILVPYIILERNWGVLIPIFSACVISLPHFATYLLERGAGSLIFTTYVPLVDVYKEFGYLPTVLFVIGVFLLFSKDGKDRFLVFGVILLLFINLLFRRFDWTLFLMPERNYLYLMLLMSIIGGVSLFKISDRRLLILLIIFLALFSIRSHLDTPYYRIIGEQEYSDFVWIRENTEQTKAVLDPWKAIAFVPVAEKNVYSTISLGPYEPAVARNREIIAFLRDDCSNTSFLIENNISIVYFPTGCSNIDLVEVRKGVYLRS